MEGMDGNEIRTAAIDNGSGAAGSAPPANDTGSASPPTAGASAGAPGAPGGAGGATTPPAHENFGARVLRNVLGALGGTEETSYHRASAGETNPQTGQPYKEGELVATSAKRGPGQQFKRIITGALFGAAAGAAQSGPGSKGKAAFAGLKAGAAINDNEEQGKKDKADDDFDHEQKALVNRASVAKMNQDIAESSWRMTREKTELGFKASTDDNAIRAQLAGDPRNEDFGVYPTFAAFLQTHGGNGKQIGEMNASLMLRAIPNIDADGKLNGVHIYKINPAWGSMVNARPESIDMGGIGADGQWHEDLQTIPAGSRTNDDILSIRQKITDQKLKWADAKIQADAAKSNTATREAGENQRAANHETHEDDRATKALNARVDAAKDKATRSDVVAHDKAYVKPANDVEKSYGMMQHAYDEYQTAKKNGTQLPTGAQSMLALSTHLATTFGNVKGARVTKDMIEHHLGARGVSDTAQVAVQRLTNGDNLSPAQWDAFHDLISQSRRLSWETAVKEANRKNIPVDFLPADLHGIAGHGAAATAPQGGSNFFTQHGGKALTPGQ